MTALSNIFKRREKEKSQKSNETEETKKYNTNFYLLIGSLLEIRANSQKIKKTLDDSRVKIFSNNDYFENEENKVYSYNQNNISKKLDEIDILLHESPKLYSQCADEVAYIHNYWKCVEYNWPNFEERKEIHLEDIEKCIECICKLIFHCNLITIPYRINRHLKKYHAGQALNFNNSFQDELCDEKQGYELLEYLSKFPKNISGYIDLKSGLIYKADPPEKRKYSYIRILLVILIGAIVFPVVLTLLSENLLTENIDFWNCFLQLMIIYAFIIAGAASHVGLDTVKQIRSDDSNSFRAINNWGLWINIKETGIIAGIVIVGIAYFGLMLSLQKIDLFTAFIVGYSVDSFADIFLLRFETTVSTKVSDIKKNLE